jgi:hypothetical protein
VRLPLPLSTTGTNPTSLPVTESPVLPWDEWKADKETFFFDLKSWNDEHQDDTLTKVLSRVDRIIEIGKPFLDMIPSQPFPASGLIKGLANLIQLGVVRLPLVLVHVLIIRQKIPGVKGAAFDFAVLVIKNITNLANTFGSEKPGPLIGKAWENLESTR